MKNILTFILLVSAFACCRNKPESKPKIRFFLHTNYMNDSILQIDSTDRHNPGDSLLAIEFFELHHNWHTVHMYTNDFHAPPDGNYVLYELDDLGIIYSKNLTWGNYERLKTNNDSINELIDATFENIILNTNLQYRSSDYKDGKKIIDNSKTDKFG